MLKTCDRAGNGRNGCAYVCTNYGAPRRIGCPAWLTTTGAALMKLSTTSRASAILLPFAGLPKTSPIHLGAQSSVVVVQMANVSNMNGKGVQCATECGRAVGSDARDVRSVRGPTTCSSPHPAPRFVACVEQPESRATRRAWPSFIVREIRSIPSACFPAPSLPPAARSKRGALSLRWSSVAG